MDRPGQYEAYCPDYLEWDDHHSIDLAREKPFQIGLLTVEPALRRLSAGSDECIVEPKMMQVLVALAQVPGAILSRDDLVETCWGGRIVGDASISRVISLLRAALRELVGEQVVIDTQPKIGYRLLVEGGDAVNGAKATADGAKTPSARVISRPRAVLAAAFLAILAIVTWWSVQPSPAAAAPEIALLPFETTDDEQQFFGRGLTEELRTELGQNYGVRFRGRNSGEAMIRAGAAPAEVAKRMGVGHVLSGQLSFENDRVRITLLLHTAEDKLPVWKGEFASLVASAGSLPPRLAKNVAAALGIALDKRFGRRTDGLPAESSYLIAQGMLRSRDPEPIATAEKLLRRITAAYPDFGGGWSALAKAQALTFGYLDPQDHAAKKAKQIEFARRGLRLDPESAEAHAVIGLVAPTANERMAHLQHAVALDPDNAEAWLWLGNEQWYAGKLQDSLRTYIKIVVLDPLWIRAEAAPQTATVLGRIALADRLDRVIEAAAIEPWNRDRARARVARRRGDWSEYIRLRRKAQLAKSISWGGEAGIDAPRIYATTFLGFPVPLLTDHPIMVMGVEILSGRMPDRATLRRHGVTARSQFWRAPNIVFHSPALYLRGGRGAEYLEIYDELFDSPEEMMARANDELNGNLKVIHAAPYLAIALREGARASEAERVLALVRPKLTDPNDWAGVRTLIDSARNYAVAGETGGAVKLLAAARERGWPHTADPFLVPLIGRLDEDPAFASLLGHSGFRRIAAEVEAERARERREVEMLPAV